MTKFSAHLGLLWADLPLAEGIRRAGAAGFSAVECYQPYGAPETDVAAALSETGLRMIGLNTAPGDSRGLSAIPGREVEALAAIDAAFDYAARVGCENVHVMAGTASGGAARDAFVAALRYAADRAGADGRGVLVEALNAEDAPGYFVGTQAEAAGIVEAVGRDEVRMLFDCYHVGRTEGDVAAQFDTYRDLIGHVQIAAVPGRGAPDHGDVDYGAVLDHLDRAGWDGFVGAEYRPAADTDESLGWLKARTGA